MNKNTYREALKQAKDDLAKAVHALAVAQETASEAEGEIVELRQTIAALAKLCGESDFIEEDALGLTDVIRQVFKTHSSAKSGSNGLDAQGVRAQMELMGYAGRWGNLLASIYTVIKRLHQQGELEAAGNINGRETFRWKESGGRGVPLSSLLGAKGQVPADDPVNRLADGAKFRTPRKTLGQRIGEKN